MIEQIKEGSRRITLGMMVTYIVFIFCINPIEGTKIYLGLSILMHLVTPNKTSM
ncbi:hypothetical protein HN784_01165 [bacterium]|nr:hypothetical protein [bacterium]MBT4251687.1 hypothetical protein [bacterium]MBT4597737.1 hypothetical protein [bacterium]MBT6753749.1 hypothetical protein [bacterium]MBT7037886.1 hypothetical protein [bacterium]